MNCHGSGEVQLDTEARPIVLVGNPNVGKSVIFGLLTGHYVTVANYPGTTVEVTTGTARWNGSEIPIIDTPGINSLIPFSEDERVTRDILLTARPAAVLQVADAKNLRRALMISLQLAEMQVPFVLDLNMDDEARARGIAIDVRRLADTLGVEVVATVATRRQGIEALLDSLARARTSPFKVAYPAPIEDAIHQMVPLLQGVFTDAAPSPEPVPRLTGDVGADLEPCLIPQYGTLRPPSCCAPASVREGRGPERALALMHLAGDASLRPRLAAALSAGDMAHLDAIREAAQSQLSEPLNYAISRARLQAADAIVADVYAVSSDARESWTAILGRLSTHPLWGLPILLFVLLLMYKFVGEFGAGTLVGLLEDTVFGEYLNPWAIRLAALIPFEIVRDLLVGQYGLVTMALTYAIAIVFPIVGTFFLAFGVLEDSGYLPRLAVMVNRVFKVMGLNGKAVLPMVLGLGCDTMATMTTRILETRKERVQVTLLLALGIPCSAQLGVILGMLGGIGPRGLTIWAGVVITVMLTVGWLSARVLPGKGSDFILELPPIRVPQLSHLAVKTLARIEWYLKEVVPLFIVGTLLLFILDKVGILGLLERLAAPLVVDFLGLPREATAAMLIGFLRRDYGAAGFFVLARNGQMDTLQVLVALVTITLFIPCIANVLMIVKEHGWKTAVAMAAFIFPLAFTVGSVVRWALVTWNVGL